MAVLINNQTGYAEDLPQQQADLALQQGTHALPLNDAQGNPVTASLDQAHTLLAQGHSQPSPQQLQSLLDYAKYSTPGQQAKAFLEGAAKDATFGLSTGIERAAGVDPNDIRGRADADPIASGLGSATGLIGSTLLGGEGAIMSRAGKAVQELTGLSEAAKGGSFLTRAASEAAKQATEMAMLQGGDEASKMFASDPHQSVQTALVDMGLSSLLGAGIGAAGSTIHPLWESTKGSKLGELLGAIKTKASGVEAADIGADLAAKSGLSMSPEMQASISGEATASKLSQELQDSGSRAGEQYRESINQLHKDASNGAVEAMGRKVEDIDALGSHSDFESGKKVQETLAQELEGITKPINEQYKPIQERFAATPLPAGAVNSIAEDLHQLALKEGYTLSETSPALKEINRITSDLPNLKTLEDLRKYQGVARNNIESTQQFRLAGQVGRLFRDAEDKTLTTMVGQHAPELMEQHAAARGAYRGAMNLIDELNDRLHVGRYKGPGSFINALREMTPEDVLRRLKGTGDAGLYDVLTKHFLDTAVHIRGYHVDSALKAASAKMPEGINTKTLFNTLNKWSPELKAFAMPQGAAERLAAIKETLERIPSRENFSNTARTLDKLWKHVPGGVAGMIGALMGHNPVTGIIMGEMAQYLGREAPDAGKLAILKFLGSDAASNPKGFKALYDMTASLQRSAQVVDKATKAVFKAGSEVVPQSYLPTAKQTQIIDKAIKAAQADPNTLQKSGEQVAHYAPEHGQAMGETAARAVDYLNSMRPNEAKPGILDKPRQPNAFEQAKYSRTLSLLEQPIMVLQHIKDGTISPDDVKALGTVYPALYQHLSDKLVNQLIEVSSRGETIPYKTRLGLSLFLGQPMDSSITPASIMLNQPLPPQAPQAPKVKGGPALSKLPGLDATPLQQRNMKK